MQEEFVRNLIADEGWKRVSNNAGSLDRHVERQDMAQFICTERGPCMETSDAAKAGSTRAAESMSLTGQSMDHSDVDCNASSCGGSEPLITAGTQSRLLADAVGPNEIGVDSRARPKSASIVDRARRKNRRRSSSDDREQTFLFNTSASPCAGEMVDHPFGPVFPLQGRRKRGPRSDSCMEGCRDAVTEESIDLPACTTETSCIAIGALDNFHDISGSNHDVFGEPPSAGDLLG